LFVSSRDNPRALKEKSKSRKLPKKSRKAVKTITRCLPRRSLSALKVRFPVTLEMKMRLKQKEASA